MPMLRVMAMVTGLAVWSLGGGGYAQVPPVFDHHVHLLSPELIKHWKSVGMTFSRPDEAYSDPIRLLENKSIRGAFLISMAHLYTTEGFQAIVADEKDEQHLIEAENDFIADCVAQAPEKLVGFFSVNPLRSYALAEMERCAQNPRLTGLKLHLPACGVELDRPEHQEKLAKILEWAAAHQTPVLLHLSAGEPYGPTEALRFWRQIVQPHRQLELYLAHLGSVSGYNESSRQILAAYQEVCRDDDRFREQPIYFDLSAAIIPEDFGELPPTTDLHCQQLAQQMHEIGMRRFVFASDYPVFSITQSATVLFDKLPLTPDEKEQLFGNASPRFADLRKTHD